MLQVPLINTLINLKGNPRISLYTEPLWGIPFNLYSPYASIFMLALGVTDVQIGIIASLSMAIQTVLALLSGPITDRLGRRKTTLIFDLISWSIPTLIWTFAQDIRYFIIAAVINAAWRITMNSWSCLVVEDAKNEQLVHIWTWVHIAGLLSAFFAPIAGVLINAAGLITGVRILYLFAFITMTSKFLILYKYSTETKQGIARLQETRDKSIFSLLKEYRGVLSQLIKTPRLVVVLSLMIVYSIVHMIDNTFWSIIVTERLGVAAKDLSWFPFARSILLLGLFFLLSSRINIKRFRSPMLLGLVSAIASKTLLVIIPSGSYSLLLVSVLLDAFGFAIFAPLLDSLVVIAIPAEERARLNALMAVLVISFSSPFGWIAGQLSDIDRSFPFILSIGLYALGTIMVAAAWRQINKKSSLLEEQPA